MVLSGVPVPGTCAHYTVRANHLPLSLTTAHSSPQRLQSSINLRQRPRGRKKQTDSPADNIKWSSGGMAGFRAAVWVLAVVTALGAPPPSPPHHLLSGPLPHAPPTHPVPSCLSSTVRAEPETHWDRAPPPCSVCERKVNAVLTACGPRGQPATVRCKRRIYHTLLLNISDRLSRSTGEGGARPGKGEGSGGEWHQQAPVAGLWS